MNGLTKVKFILVTPLFILLSYYISFFAHEYAHSFTAWILGDKANPWIIHFGDTSWLNLIFLLKVDEFVDYARLFALNQGVHAAIIAFAGIGIGNAFFYLLSLGLLQDKSLKLRPFLYYFLFWLNFCNLANFYDYIPIRTFSANGDMANIAMGLAISPWFIYIFLGYIVAFLLWFFFTRTLIAAFINLGLVTTYSRASLMMVSVLLMFGYFGLAGLMGYGEISHFLSATSLIAIPGIILACWPAREWVIRQVDELEQTPL